MLLQAEQMHKMTCISLKMVKVVILSKKFVILSISQLQKSQVLNQTTPKIQHRKQNFENCPFWKISIFQSAIFALTFFGISFQPQPVWHYDFHKEMRLEFRNMAKCHLFEIQIIGLKCYIAHPIQFYYPLIFFRFIETLITFTYKSQIRQKKKFMLL